MTRRPSGKERRACPPLAATIRGTAFTTDGVEVILHLRNDGERALHYVRSVRTLRYDPGTRKLVVGLTDEGLDPVPGSSSVHPQFGHVNPHDTSELRLRLPARFVKLAPTASSSGGLQFEEYFPANAAEIEVRIAWADTPFYEDPRAVGADAVPTESWAMGKATSSFQVPAIEPKRPGARTPKPRARPKG